MQKKHQIKSIILSFCSDVEKWLKVRWWKNPIWALARFHRHFLEAPEVRHQWMWNSNNDMKIAIVSVLLDIRSDFCLFSFLWDNILLTFYFIFHVGQTPTNEINTIDAKLLKSKSGNAIDKLNQFLKDVEVHSKQNGAVGGGDKSQFVSKIPQSKSRHGSRNKDTHQNGNGSEAVTPAEHQMWGSLSHFF